MRARQALDLYRVTARSFAAGFVVCGDTVVEAAPIIQRRTLGRLLTDALRLLQDTHCEVEKVSP